jgi:hypothetical protein
LCNPGTAISAEHGRSQHPAAQHDASSAVHIRHGFQAGAIQLHGDELRDRVLRHAHPRISEVGGIIDLRSANIDVHPFHRLVGGVVDGVRATHAVGRADGRFEQRGAAVYGELGLAG